MVNLDDYVDEDAGAADFDALKDALKALADAIASTNLAVMHAAQGDAGGATQRVQAPLEDEDLEVWLAVIHAAAAATKGPEFLARVNDGCRHCPVRTSCPAHDEGRQVTSE